MILQPSGNKKNLKKQLFSNNILSFKDYSDNLFIKLSDDKSKEDDKIDVSDLDKFKINEDVSNNESTPTASSDPFEEYFSSYLKEIGIDPNEISSSRNVFFDRYYQNGKDKGFFLLPIRVYNKQDGSIIFQSNYASCLKKSQDIASKFGFTITSIKAEGLAYKVDFDVDSEDDIKKKETKFNTSFIEQHNGKKGKKTNKAASNLYKNNYKVDIDLLKKILKDHK